MTGKQFKLVARATNEKGSQTLEFWHGEPGAHFERFGGSRHGLTVRKTASIVVRETTATGQIDTEYGADDLDIWLFMARALGAFGATGTVEVSL